jgi:biotin---protein ligase
VTVISTNGQEKTAKIIGIDNFGFLEIQIDDGKKIESVQPDGNSFDMIRGLIIPKTP